MTLPCSQSRKRQRDFICLLRSDCLDQGQGYQAGDTVHQRCLATRCAFLHEVHFSFFGQRAGVREGTAVMTSLLYYQEAARSTCTGKRSLGAGLHRRGAFHNMNVPETPTALDASAKDRNGKQSWVQMRQREMVRLHLRVCAPSAVLTWLRCAIAWKGHLATGLGETLHIQDPPPHRTPAAPLSPSLSPVKCPLCLPSFLCHNLPLPLTPAPACFPHKPSALLGRSPLCFLLSNIRWIRLGRWSV